MCMIDFGGETCTVFKNTWRTARKTHCCGDCSTTVKPGERYRSHFSVYEGEPCHGAICKACADASDEFFAAHGAGGVQRGAFGDYLDACIMDEPDDDDSARWSEMYGRLAERRRAARAAS